MTDEIRELILRRDALLSELGSVTHKLKLAQIANYRRGADGKLILSVRARNALANLGTDIADATTVAQLSRFDLARTSNVGSGTIAEIEAWLAEHGLKLNQIDQWRRER